MESLVELRDINFKVGNSFLFKNDINISINEKQIIFLVGSSGSGKTTIWKIASYLTEPSKGKVIWKGKEVKSKDEANKLRNEILSLYPSKYLFFEELTAEENLKIIGSLLKKDVKQKIEELNETFKGITNKDLFFENIKHKDILVILEALAANAGSALTPLGNPQNLYIYWFYDVNPISFVLTIAPLSLVFLLILALASLFIKSRKK
ncbi:MAG: hypothetical protein DSY42_08245, partial [Aquifex sp.]